MIDVPSNQQIQKDYPDTWRIQKDVLDDQKTSETEEGYEDLSGSCLFAIEYLLGIACYIRYAPKLSVMR